MTEDEIQAIENHISNIPAIAGMYAPVMLKWLRAMLKEREELLRLAYIGEHYFPDLSWKTRCEELLDELHERKEYAEQVEQDWRDAKSEFGSATSKLRERVRQLQDCGQDGPCVISPGCQRHLLEHTRTLLAEAEERGAKWAIDERGLHGKRDTRPMARELCERMRRAR